MIILNFINEDNNMEVQQYVNMFLLSRIMSHLAFISISASSNLIENVTGHKIFELPTWKPFPCQTIVIHFKDQLPLYRRKPSYV